MWGNHNPWHRRPYCQPLEVCLILQQLAQGENFSQTI